MYFNLILILKENPNKKWTTNKILNLRKIKKPNNNKPTKYLSYTIIFRILF